MVSIVLDITLQTGRLNVIIVCARCKRHVDAGAASPGETIRCPCGLKILVPAGPTEAGKINCPACGAPVDPAAGRCSFCDTRLATGLCPKCFGATFAGVKYCPHCGEALAGRLILPGSETKYQCPRCKDESLRVEVVGGCPLDRCERCEGMWLDRETLEKIYKEREQNAAIKHITAPRLKAVSKDKPVSAASRSKNKAATQGYIRCPMCNAVMDRQNFGRYSGVVVDICRKHGTWFDADELNRIMLFISDGGLQKSALKEQRALEDEVRRLKSQCSMGGGILMSEPETGYNKNIAASPLVAIAWNLLKRVL
jgi:Zn-finger nucleic acid-binding protein